MPGKSSKAEETVLDEVGFKFVNRCIEVLEKRGMLFVNNVLSWYHV